MLGCRQWKLLGSGIIPWYNRNEGRCTISTGLNGGFKYGSPCHTGTRLALARKAFAEKQTKSKNKKKVIISRMLSKFKRVARRQDKQVSTGICGFPFSFMGLHFSGSSGRVRCLPLTMAGPGGESMYPR